MQQSTLQALATGTQPENLTSAQPTLSNPQVQPNDVLPEPTQSQVEAQAQTVASTQVPHPANQPIQAKADPWADEGDEWAKPISDPELQKVVAQAADEQLRHLIGRGVLPLLVAALVLFSSGFGMLQGALLVKDQSMDAAQMSAQMANLAGSLSDLGMIGCALWTGLSSLVGCLAILLPVYVYYSIGRRNLRSKHVGLAIYDFLRAEALKYGLIVVILGCCLKFTELRAAVMLISFALTTILELVLRLWYLPKPEQLQQYWQHKANAAQKQSEQTK